MTVNGTCITMVKGDTESLLVRLTDDYGNPYNFAIGDTVYFTVASVNPLTGALAEVIQKTVTIASATNEATITIAGAYTSSLPLTVEYKYDVQWTSAGGRRTIIPMSDFVLIEQVTTNG